MRAVRYLRPSGVEEALAALAERSWTVVAGCTDHYPARVGRPLDDDVLDITGIAALRGIAREAGHWRIPALATWSDLLAAPGLPRSFDGLKRAARDIGGAQIQNVGTICGNLCNASPAADGTPNLMALDAEVELASLRGRRRLSIADFVAGNRRTAREADELMSAVLVPHPAHEPRSSFLKLGARRYLVIAIAMVAAAIEVDGKGAVARAGIAVGACSAVARRLPRLEAELLGRPADRGLASVPEARHLACLAPIDDVRGTAEYRRDAALTLVRRALAALAP